MIRDILKFAVIITAGLILAGCGASSISTRYYEEEKPTEKTTVRVDTVYIIQHADSTMDNFGESYFSSRNIGETPFFEDSFLEKYDKIVNSGIPVPPFTRMYIEIIKYIETPYLYGGIDVYGMDCSGFTTLVFGSAFGIQLPRSSADQYRMDGMKINSISDLQRGDLVFFKIRDRRNPDHVGIYLEDGKFAHAGLSTGVTISSFDTDYFRRHFYAGNRILPDSDNGTH